MTENEKYIKQSLNLEQAQEHFNTTQTDLLIMSIVSACFGLFAFLLGFHEILTEPSTPLASSLSMTLLGILYQQPCFRQHDHDRMRPSAFMPLSVLFHQLPVPQHPAVRRVCGIHQLPGQEKNLPENGDPKCKLELVREFLLCIRYRRTAAIPFPQKNGPCGRTDPAVSRYLPELAHASLMRGREVF